jgi:hypothetical protein
MEQAIAQDIPAFAAMRQSERAAAEAAIDAQEAAMFSQE